MGEVADDVFETAERTQAMLDAMKEAGCKRCPDCWKHATVECPTCLDLGWIDKDGKPCEL